MKRQSGSGTILLFAVLIPTLFIASTVLFGVLQTSDERKNSQRILDENLLVAARFLPDITTAKAQLNLRLQNALPNLASTHYVISREDSLGITVTVKNKSSYLNRFVYKGLETHHTVGAQVSIRPQDIIIFFDSSQYVAPLTYGRHEDAPWLLTVRRDLVTGKFKDEYRARFGFFEGFQELSEDDASDIYHRNPRDWGIPIGNFDSRDETRRQNARRTLISKLASHWQAANLFTDPNLINTKLNPELRTPSAFKQLYYSQKCFNPTFNGIKQAAIELWDNFAASLTNRVAVVSGPISGNVSPPFQHKEIFELTDNFVIGGNPFIRGKAELENSKKVAGTISDPRVRDQECWQAMKIDTDRWIRAGAHEYFTNDSTGKPVYVIPPAPSYLASGIANAPGIISPPTPRFDNYELDRHSIKNLSVRDAIWARAVSTRRLEFPKLINYLEDTVPRNPGNTISKNRGFLSHQVEHKAFLIMGDFPWFIYDGHPISLGKVHLTPNEDDGPATEDPSVIPVFKNLLRAQFNLLNQSLATKKIKLTLYISIPRHEGSYPQSLCHHKKDCPKFKEHFLIFQDFINQHREDWPSLDIVPIAASDPGTVALDLTNSLISAERSYLLNYL